MRRIGVVEDHTGLHTSFLAEEARHSASRPLVPSLSFQASFCNHRGPEQHSNLRHQRPSDPKMETVYALVSSYESMNKIYVQNIY